MNEQLIIEINNYLQKLTENVVKPMYGIRDENSLHLIFQSLEQEVFGVELHPTIFDKASYLWYSLANYHCFYNGNKRTALVTTYLYLRLNGFNLKIDSRFYDISMNIVEFHMEQEKIKEIIQENTIETSKLPSKNMLEHLEIEINNNSPFKEVIVKLSQT
ncbi:type II toxin-antitoxin system death-on-curing family toxin [Listeria monocytogenes serotype 4c]|uniref:type II toxin-antitoxin system death-on-curing family toxin n=1 Tax=Listeria monocytogenes TaxID=1639 RepID=UPI000F1F310B|nr:type II toxin-antitoxin system death-on-curing family toxin [Listeria monocytogenes]MCY63400.1 type II toxin-antitoxin system death-on-curing family toxin [Listeria monocytogenes serotype 4c]EAC4665008.1 type II toxin-antitoxin system death-on-curing family toxin [Listeria monocytogenes]EAD3477553.1 type II toxin-antitoxin system death-on-curing family toxin [Listeria monocytogenes]EAD9020564.1 type II toxin-antitoxin system death-on-curing family toxin [Listeria monocytogenes]EBF5196192.1 